MPKSILKETRDVLKIESNLLSTAESDAGTVISGMEGVDKEKVQKVIYEMSKGSKYFENEQRKEAFIKQKVENLQQQCAKLTDKDIAHFQKVISSLFVC